ncbi:ferric reductase like transmembrane component-domain-containing protein [Coniochaeta sp. 2T2.1]|nr:ferric reductase like transmembrane component-domain-containing protein [Coniochaeta sp. 2T2.1]
MSAPAPAVAANATTSGGTGQAGAAIAGTGGVDPDVQNILLSNYLFWTLACISGALIIWRISTEFIKYVRHVTCLSNETQRYFAIPSGKFSWFKKNIHYAPLINKRHNREFQLSNAINVGTLPTRLQFVFLVGYFATNVAFCVIAIPFAGSFTAAAAQLRSRSGVLAVANMIPLFIFAGRNNPLIKLLGISFDTYNLLHRWLGRVVVLESLAHVMAWFVSNAHTKGWASAIRTATTVPYMLFGFVATVALVAMFLQAVSPVRHAHYEMFKIIHILLAIVAVVGIWYHLDLKDLSQIKYLYAVVAIWGLDHLARWIRLTYHNIGSGGTKTVVEALPGNACRVTVTMARPWSFKPGQHAYLYFPTISYWQSHPFSAAWSDEAEAIDSIEKLPMDRQEVLAMNKTSISFIIRARTGATNALYERASAFKDGRMLTRCLVEGPYGGHHQLQSYGTVMLFAGGVGITHQVPHVRDLVIGYANGTVAARKVVLIWVIQSPEHLEWIRPWMTEILALDRRREVLKIMLFVSRPRSTKEIHSPSATVQMFPGRPNIDTLLGIEMENQIGTLGVSVCGPGALSDDVRSAVRGRQYQGAIDFVEESFSW